MLLTLIEKHVLTEDTRSYTFSHEGNFVFLPGQFVMLSQPGAETKFRRAFSMASAPTASHVTFLVKHNPDGHVSGYLENAVPGTQIEAAAPVGRFTLAADDSTRIFIATGTGLAPIISFIESGLGATPTEILFGVRDESHVFWKNKLPEGAMITLSRPSASWTGLHGRVTDHVPSLLEKHPDAGWYICGNPDMVKEVRGQLLAANIPATKIHFEIY